MGQMACGRRNSIHSLDDLAPHMTCALLFDQLSGLLYVLLGYPKLPPWIDMVNVKTEACYSYTVIATLIKCANCLCARTNSHASEKCSSTQSSLPGYGHCKTEVCYTHC